MHLWYPRKMDFKEKFFLKALEKFGLSYSEMKDPRLYNQPRVKVAAKSQSLSMDPSVVLLLVSVVSLLVIIAGASGT